MERRPPGLRKLRHDGKTVRRKCRRNLFYCKMHIILRKYLYYKYSNSGSPGWGCRSYSGWEGGASVERRRRFRGGYFLMIRAV